jgi:hypothetical protein
MFSVSAEGVVIKPIYFINLSARQFPSQSAASFAAASHERPLVSSLRSCRCSLA